MSGACRSELAREHGVRCEAEFASKAALAHPCASRHLYIHV